MCFSTSVLWSHVLHPAHTSCEQQALAAHNITHDQQSNELMLNDKNPIATKRHKVPDTAHWGSFLLCGSGMQQIVTALLGLNKAYLPQPELSPRWVSV